MSPRGLVVPLMLLLAACAAGPSSSSPYIPPSATYSAGSTLSALGGALAVSAGAEMLDSRHSPRTRKVGIGALAAGLGLLGVAVWDALQVEEARRNLVQMDSAWRQPYANRPLPEPFRPPPPPLPEVPLEFPEEKSPLAGDGP